MPHSATFNNYNLVMHLGPLQYNILKNQLATDFLEGKVNYVQLQRLLIEHIDSQYGIESEFRDEPNRAKSPTGVCLIRDAHNANLPNLPGDQHKSIVSNDLLLRMLAVTRATDHLLAQRAEKSNKNAEYEGERRALKKIYFELLNEVIAFQTIGDFCLDKRSKNYLNSLEKKYNQDLINILHRNYLDIGLKSKKDYQGFLLHLRCLASTLDPAPAVETIIRDEVYKATHTEIAYPITEKTATQKDSLSKSLNQIITNPIKEQINFQTTQPLAIQTANAAFADLIIQDDRRLPAQARKAIPHSVKNGYLTHYRIRFDDNPNEIYQYFALRCGSVVYVGKGERKEQLLEYAKENFRQLQKFARTKAGKEKIHLTSLITYFPRNDENTIYSISQEARQQLGFNFSSTPLNVIGTFYPTSVSSHVRKNSNITSRVDISNKRNRLNRATSVGLIFNPPQSSPDNSPQSSLEQLPSFTQIDNNQVINLHMCASGQDRTGTADEACKQKYSNLVYLHHEITKAQLGISEETIQRIIINLSALPKESINHITIKNMIVSTFEDTRPRENKTLVLLSERLAAILNTGGANSINTSHIDTLRAKAMVSPFLATFAAPGSFGMKTDSKPSYYFNRITEMHSYLKTADTNTQVLLDKKDLDTILKANEGNSFALSDIPTHSTIYSVWKREARSNYPCLADIKQIDEKLKAYKCLLESEASDSDKITALDAAKKAVDIWLQSKFNQYISDRLPAVEKLQQNLALEIQLLEDKESLNAALTNKLIEWINSINNIVKDTNSTGIKQMHKLCLRYLSNISADTLEAKINLLAVEQKIGIYKAFRNIANDRLEDSFLTQHYRRAQAPFFGKKGRAKAVQELYEIIKQPEFLNTSKPEQLSKTLSAVAILSTA